MGKSEAAKRRIMALLSLGGQLRTFNHSQSIGCKCSGHVVSINGWV